MSSLISSDDLLRLVVFGEKPPTPALHATGIDLEVLEHVFKVVKPELNYFDKYSFATLESSFGGWKEGRIWEDWYQASPKVHRFKQVMMLGYVEIMDDQGKRQQVRSDSSYRSINALVRVYLAKSGEWIVWTNYPQSRFEVVRSASKAMKIAYEILPDHLRFAAQRLYGYDDAYPRSRKARGSSMRYTVVLDSLAMEVASALVANYDKFAKEREHRAAKSRQTHASLQQLIDRVDI